MSDCCDETRSEQKAARCPPATSDNGCCSPATDDNEKPSCCGPDAPRWVITCLETPAGPVRQVRTELTRADLFDRVKARLGVARMSYTVDPGIYAVGKPTAESPVFVTANYKLSFDSLRRELGGIDGWILVLDTKGVNVWCAAGKGTFGTEELVHRLQVSNLAAAVSHRDLVLPQLGAPGVAAHAVRKESGFKVVYGPVRAADLPAFLAAGNRATPEMRRVRFGLFDRFAVIPVDLVFWAVPAAWTMLLLFLLSGLGRSGFSWSRASALGSRWAGLVFLAYLGGAALTPLLLPWLPWRSFSAQGAAVGLLLAGAGALTGWIPFGEPHLQRAGVGWFLLIPAISAFLAMNYTGASTFTSLSGVKREMKAAVPMELAAAALGLALLIWSLF